MSKIEELLEGYYTKQTEELEGALDGFTADNQRASQQIGDASRNLHSYAVSSQQQLKVSIKICFSLISRVLVAKNSRISPHKNP